MPVNLGGSGRRIRSSESYLATWKIPGQPRLSAVLLTERGSGQRHLEFRRWSHTCGIQVCLGNWNPPREEPFTESAAPHVHLFSMGVSRNPHFSIAEGLTASSQSFQHWGVKPEIVASLNCKPLLARSKKPKLLKILN